MSEEPRAETAPVELISFEIGGQAFCLDVRSVREIRGWTPATPMPQTPDYILGVINLRGAVMPVVDLRNRLGLGHTVPTSRHVIVVIQHGGRTVGVLVDGVQDTFQVDTGQMQPPPELAYTSNELFVDAIIPLEGRMLSRLVVGALMPADQTAAA